MSLRIVGETSIDYFMVRCEKCQQPVKIKYLGWDPAVPHIEAKCKKCGSSGKLKLSNWTGLPAKPSS